MVYGHERELNDSRFLMDPMYFDISVGLYSVFNFARMGVTSGGVRGVATPQNFIRTPPNMNTS
jgi:hypothetical protein